MNASSFLTESTDNTHLTIDVIMSLLKKGLIYIQQGRDAEGTALLALGRKQLPAEQAELAATLDMFIQGYYTTYHQAWQALQEASLHFTQEHLAYQARVTHLSEALPALLQSLEPASAPPLGEEISHVHTVPHPTPTSLSTPSATLPRPITTAITEHACAALPELFITCFGHFTVKRLGKPVQLCASRKGQSILRYLVAQSSHSTTIDTLMSLFWSEEEPEVAQSKLHIAMSALRRALNNGYSYEPGMGYITCKNRVYALNPAVVIHTDIDEFEQRFHARQPSRQIDIANYEYACQLYTGPFLVEDLYADWSFLRREQLSQMYLTMCSTLVEHYIHNGHYESAAKWANATLMENRCEEAAHRQLIHIYMLQGRRSEALQQYQRCERILREELGVQPLPETKRVLQDVAATQK